MSYSDKVLSSFLLEQGYAVKEVAPTTEQEIGKSEVVGVCVFLTL